MKINYKVVDAFCHEHAKGNPAAVIQLDRWLTKQTMQKIATELNLSETAFIVKQGDKYHIRWFSPMTEIDFCGHATLASASVVFSESLDTQTLVFYATSVGDINVTKQKDRIEMMFPNQRPTTVDAPPAELIDGIMCTATAVLKNNQAYVVILPAEKDVRELKVKLSLLKQLAPLDVVVSAKGTNYDFVSRYFWPANGGDEDPVTGSIHAALAPYWSEQLNKRSLTAYQASSRGGVLYCELKGNKVMVSGHAVISKCSQLTVPIEGLQQ